MESNSNESFTLTKEQIRFIDDKFINKKKELKNVIEELVKQPNNNFQKEDVEQIIELYIKIKRLERSKRQYGDIRNLWIQAELKILIDKIKEEGENINISASARELAKKEQLKFHTVVTIKKKLYYLINELPELSQIKLRRSQKRWNQTKQEIVINKIEEEGENINISASAQELAKKEQLKFHTVGAIAQKFYKLKRQLQYTQEKNKITENAGAENNNYINTNSQNNDGIDENSSKKFEEKLNKCFNDTEQLNNTKNRLTKINTSENNKSNFICFDRKNDKQGENLKQLLDKLGNLEQEIPEIPEISEINFCLSFKPSNTSGKDPIFQHPYLSLPDISDLSSNEHSI